MLRSLVHILKVIEITAISNKKPRQGSSVIKSTRDKNEYDHYTLKNNIPVVIVRNPVFNVSGCALSVRAGYYEDPLEIGGLAHLVEHMLFMGTEKYPGVNEFDLFMSMNSGTNNAYTTAEYTTYMFYIDSKHIRKALDMLAHFFISPLFDKKIIDREINSLNSEFENTKGISEWWTYAMIRELAKPESPISYFGSGSISTLNTEKIYEAVKEFWKTKYSSDIMTLVVCTNASLEDVKDMLQIFEKIENKNLLPGKREKISAPGEFKSISSEIFKESAVGKVVRCKSLDNKAVLSIHFFLPQAFSAFKTNPIRYLEQALREKGKGGLLSKLKKKNLASSIETELGFFTNTTEFALTIGLTETGFKNYESIITIVHEYITNLKANRCDYKRQRMLANTTFTHTQVSSVMIVAKDIATNMHFYPVTNALNMEYMYSYYDPVLINSCISGLAEVNKWIVLLISPDSNITYKNTEKYYGIGYDFLGDCKGFVGGETKRPRPPCSDEFLENLNVIKAQRRYLKRREYSNGEINLVFDSEFDTPKAYINIIFSSLRVKQNPVIYELYFHVLLDMFIEEYGRKIRNALVSFSVKSKPEGILVRVSGFSEKIIEITELLITSISKWTVLSPDMSERLSISNMKFELVRQKVLDSYIDVTSNGLHKNLDQEYGHAAGSMKSLNEIIETIKGTKRKHIRFKRYFFCRIIAVGNIEFNKIEKLFGTISREYLKDKKPLWPVQFNITQPEKVKLKMLDKNSHAVGIYYFINKGRTKVTYGDHEAVEDGTVTSDDQYDINTAIGQLIWQIGREMFFNQLRTTEQLGYIVYSTVYEFMTGRYLSFIVQSDRKVEFIKDRIVKFVVDLKKHIEDISLSLFETHKQSVAGVYRMPAMTLEELNTKIMKQWRSGKIDLNYEKKIINIINKLTVKDVISSEIWNGYGMAYSSDE